MKIVIDIPENTFKSITKWEKPNDDTRLMLWTLLKSGTPLPKGHGDLKDVNEIWRLYYHTDDMDYTMFDALNDTPIIIKADNVESEENECLI